MNRRDNDVGVQRHGINVRKHAVGDTRVFTSHTCVSHTNTVCKCVRIHTHTHAETEPASDAALHMHAEGSSIKPFPTDGAASAECTL